MLLEAVVGFYAAMGVITLLLFAWDKSASQRAGARRVRERTLHLWTIAGGFLGTALGLVWLRHKTRHPSFVCLSLLAAGLHAAGWAWWLGWF